MGFSWLIFWLGFFGTISLALLFAAAYFVYRFISDSELDERAAREEYVHYVRCRCCGEVTIEHRDICHGCWYSYYGKRKS